MERPLHDDPNILYAPPSAAALSDRHEPSEARLAVVIGFAAALAVTVALVLVICIGVQKLLSSPDTATRAHVPPPEPALQPSADHNTLDKEDLARLRAQEDAILNSYAWIGNDRRTARIPIDRAMDELLVHGLPTRQEKHP